MKKITLFTIAFILTTHLVGQNTSSELISSSGESFKNTTYQLDWSVGDNITASHSLEDYVITQGFHQTNSVIAEEKQLPDIITDMSVYPNPTSDLLVLKTPLSENYLCEITDIKGNYILKEKITEPIKEMHFNNYADGIYFLTVKHGRNVLKTFKIIKH
ncbi:MAG: T9SS type A sorting domain-containing protein [bacterium]|nr:T9SS type A sorting domain-containing protein [bacterium]